MNTKNDETLSPEHQQALKEILDILKQAIDRTEELLATNPGVVVGTAAVRAWFFGIATVVSVPGRPMPLQAVNELITTLLEEIDDATNDTEEPHTEH